MIIFKDVAGLKWGRSENTADQNEGRMLKGLGLVEFGPLESGFLLDEAKRRPDVGGRMF